MTFEIWHYWFIAAFLFLLLEIFIPGFIVGSIGLGCLLAALGAFIHLPLWFNIILFIAGFFVGITMLKPMLKKFEQKSAIKFNAEGLIGKKGKVIEQINPTKNTGCVRIDGDDWKAVSQNDEIIEAGSAVEVTAIESIVLTVRTLNSSPSTSSNTASENEKPVAQSIKNNKGLIVTTGNKKEIVYTEEIACFYSQQKTTFMVTIEGKQRIVDESLEKVEERLESARFFRANRQFIISNHLIKSTTSQTDGKLEVSLKPLPNLPESISVSRLKSHAFRKWLQKQV